MTEAPQRILIVDDEHKTVELVRLYLEHAGFATEAAYDGPQALQQARAASPDLVILDVMLPGLDGFAVCNALRAQSDVPILMLTARVSGTDKVSGLELGADDYITKPFDPKELVARVRAVLRRSAEPEGAHGPKELHRGGLMMNYPRHEASLAGAPLQLRPIEFDLLWTLARAPGRVFSREELIARVHGYDFEGTSRAMDIHILGLRRKIEPDPGRPRYIQTVYGVGYRFGGSDVA